MDILIDEPRGSGPKTEILTMKNTVIVKAKEKARFSHRAFVSSEKCGRGDLVCE